MLQSIVIGEFFSGVGDSGIVFKVKVLKEENKDQNGLGIIDSNVSVQIDDIFEKFKVE